MLKSPYFLAFGTLYLLAVFTLATSGVYSLAEPLFMLVIFGVLLPGTAYLLCRPCVPIGIRAPDGRRELPAMLALVALVIVYLVWGSDWIDCVVYSWTEETPRFDLFLTIGKKVLIFVAVPYLVLSRAFAYRWRDFGFVMNIRSAFAPPYLVLMAVFFVLYLAIQGFIGQAAQPVFRGDFSTATVIVSGLLSYALLVVEVGLVEEFFFRAVLQTRLAAWLKSESAGLFLMALIFGLAHAPGLYLREAGAVTSLGAAPDVATTLAYSVAVISLAGLAFGVIWARTRNIYVLILIHAWVDVLPGLPEFIFTFGLR